MDDFGAQMIGQAQKVFFEISNQVIKFLENGLNPDLIVCEGLYIEKES